MLLFDASSAQANAPALIQSIRETCAKERGSAFYLAYLQQVAESIEKPKWNGVENLRTALVAILQHHQATTRRIAEIEDENLAAAAEKEKRIAMKGKFAQEEDEEEAAASAKVEAEHEAGVASRAKELVFRQGMLPELFLCVEVLLGLSMRTDSTFSAVARRGA